MHIRIVPAGIAAFMSFGTLSSALAGPTGGTVVSGQATIRHPDGSTTLINQSSSNAQLDWSTFNVAQGERVQFAQPSSSAVALNRILDQNPSQIFGQLDANGHVVLVNPNGIVFGRTAQVNVGSLVASSLNVTSWDAASGHLTLSSANAQAGAVVNDGTITAAPGGSVALLGATVLNNGLIVADYGSVNLASGRTATLDFFGGGLLRLQVDGEVTSNPTGAASAVENTGKIQANGGQVFLTANAARGVFANSVNNEGVIRASRIENSGGTIRLLGPGGTVSNSGTLDASGTSAGTAGGDVQVLGQTVQLSGTSVVDVSGQSGGGTALVGGDFHGSNPDVLNAQQTMVDAGAVIRANALTSGNGGKVVVWADDATVFNGRIEAKALGAYGTGGMAEVSGKQHLTITGHADLEGAAGENGTLLLDPGTVTIDSGGNNTTNQPDIIHDGWINSQLISSNLTVTTANGTTGTEDLIVNGTADPGGAAIISWNNGSTLTLTGNNSINFHAGATIDSSGPGRLILNSSSGAITLGTITLTHGNLAVNGGGGAITQNGALVVGGTTFLKAGSTNDITLSTAGNQLTGAVTILSGNNVSLDNGTHPLAMGHAAISGNLVLSSGAMTQSGTLLVTGTTDLTAGSSNSIVFGANGNQFTNTVTVHSGSDVTLNGGANLLSLGTSTVSGNLSVSGAGVAQSGPLKVTGSTTVAAGAANDVKLDNASNNLTGPVTLTSGNSVTLNNGANPLILGTSAVSGNLALTAAGVTQTGALTVAGSTSLSLGAGTDAVLDQAGNQFGGPVGVTSGANATLVNSGVLLQLGSINITGALSARAITGDILGTSPLVVGGASTFTADAAGASINVNNPANAMSGAVNFAGAGGLQTITLVNTFPVNLPALTLTGGLGVSSTGSITQSGVLSIAGAVSLSAGTTSDIVLNNAANHFGSLVRVTGRNVSLNDTVALLLGGSTVSGDLVLSSAAGITQRTGPLAVNGTTTLTPGAGSDVVLLQTGNQLNGAVSVTSGTNVTLTNASDLNLGAINISGSLSAHALSGNISNSGALVIGGASTFTADAAGASINVNNAGNAFTGPVSFVGAGLKDVSIADTLALPLPALTLTGNLAVSAVGISEAGVLTVGGTTSLSAGATNNIKLLDSNNQFTGAVSVLSGQNVILRTGTNALVLGASHVSGNLSVGAGGLTQTGSLTVDGTTSLGVGAANDITLSMAGNHLTGTVRVASGNNVTLNNGANALDMGDSTISGKLVLSSGTLTQSGAVGVTGTTLLSAGTGNDITFGNNGNQFTGAVSVVSGRDVTLNNGANPLVMGTSVISQNLALAGAGVTQAGALSVIGATSVAGGAGTDVVLDQAANRFQGAVGVTSGSNATIVNAIALNLGSTNITGALSAQALSGDISNSGALLIGGVSTFTADVAGASINVNNAGNAFSGPVSFVGAGLKDVSIADTLALTLPALTLSGNLNASSAMAITQSGALSVAGTTTLTAGATSDVVLANANNKFQGAVGITSGSANVNDSVALLLGASSVSNGVLLTSGAGITQTGSLTVGGAATFTAGPGSDVVLTQAGNQFNSLVGVTSGANVNLVNAGTLNLGGITITGVLSAHALSGNISGTGALAIGGSSTFTADAPGASIILNDSHNALAGPVSFGGSGGLADVSIADTLALNLQALTLTGDLTASGAGITQSGALTVGGSSSFAAAAGTDVLLTQASNAFTGPVRVISGANATLVNNGALKLGASTVTGALSAEARTGNISSSGALVVGGASTFTADAAGASISVNDPGNAFTGAVIFAGAGGLANVSIADTLALNLSALTLTGNLTASGAGITQSGALTVGGSSSFAAAAGTDVLLTQAGNAFTGPVRVTSGANATLVNSGALNLGASTVTGALSAESRGGNITSSGRLVVGGASTFTVDGAGASIIVDDAGNAFAGPVGFVGPGGLANVSVMSTLPLSLQASTLTGDLTANAPGITQAGALSVSGRTSLNAGTNDINLTTAGNQFGGAVSASGNNVSLSNGTSALTLGDLNVGGTLSLSAGAISQAVGDNLTVAGSSTLSSGAGEIVLANTGNHFTGAVAVTGNDVTLNNGGNALVAGTVTTTGKLTLTAAGITQDGAIGATGPVTLVAGANDITLGNAGNNITGVVTVASGRNVVLTDAGTLSLGASTVSGNLSLTGAGIAQTGALSVAGTTQVAAAGGDISLTQVGNQFAGAVAVTSAVNATIVNGGALNLAASSVTGILNAEARTGNITSGGALVVGGASTFTADAAGASISVDNTGNAFTGPVGFVGPAGLASVSVRNTLPLSLQASTVTGDLMANAPGITQTGTLSVGGRTLLNAGTQDINLTTAGNQFGGAVSASGNNVSLRNGTTALTLGDLNVGGGLNLSAGAISQTVGDNLTVAGSSTLSSGAGDIALANAGNHFSGAVAVTGNNITLNNGGNALIMGASATTGQVTLTGAGITQNGAIGATGPVTLVAGANDITLNDAGNNITGVVTVASGRNVVLTDAGTLSLGASTVSGNLSLTGAGIAQTGALSVAGTMQVAAGGGDIALTQVGNQFAGTVGVTNALNATIVNGRALTLGASTVAGALNAEAATGNISSSGALVVGGASTFTVDGAGASISVDNAGNAFTGPVGFVGSAGLANVSVVDSLALNLQALTLSGNLTASAAGLTQAGPLSVGGATSLAAVAGDITFNNAGNQFTGALSASGRNVTLGNAGPLTLGSSTVARNLTVTAGGPITQNGALTVGGSSTFDAGAGNDITLTAANDFGTVAIAAGRNVHLNDVNAIDLGTSGIAGTLAITSNGAITQSGALRVAGATTLAAAADITLQNASNALSTVAVTSGRNVSLTNGGALVLAGSTVAGSLSVNAGGAITQSGGLHVSGSTSLAAGNNNDITLTGANDFATVGVASGRNVTLNSVNAIDLGASSIAGTLTVNANGAMTQSGALNVAGATMLAAGTGNDITLGNAANTFAAIGITSGRNVTLVNAGALSLGASTVAGTLAVTTNGAITQSGPVTVGAAATFSAGNANDVTLNSANDFSTVSIASARNATLSDTNALTLGKSTVSGSFSATAGGAITGSGLITANSLKLQGTSLGARSRMSDISQFISTNVGSLDLTATSGGVFVNQSGSVQVLNASATGNVELIAQGANSNLTVASVTAGGHALLIAGDNILAASGAATMAAPFVELRAGIENANGAIGSVALPLGVQSAASQSPSVDLVLPQSTINVSEPREIPHIFSPASTNATQVLFTGNHTDLYTAPFGTAAALLNVNAAAFNLAERYGTFDAAKSEDSTAGREVLYIDWSSFDPNVSLFGTVNPGICLPSDQREEDSGGSGCVAGAPRPDFLSSPMRTALVLTRQGWKTFYAVEVPVRE
jgi:filamentous hemagglutinin family protein